MKKLFFMALSLILFACAPVLNRELMREGERNPSLDQLRANPATYQGKIFILGGIIVETRLIQEGSQIEVLGFPVDSRGYLEEGDRARGRFFAVYPREKGLLDPIVYKKGRQVTLAGQLTGTREGKIDDMEYVFPVFEIRQVHLWEDEDYAFYPYRYPYSYYPYADPLWYHPYWRPGPWPPPPGWW
jgi:outer membrane lipoprotein